MIWDRRWFQRKRLPELVLFSLLFVEVYEAFRLIRDIIFQGMHLQKCQIGQIFAPKLSSQRPHEIHAANETAGGNFHCQEHDPAPAGSPRARAG